MSDTCLQVKSAVNYRKCTGLSDWQTEWCLSQWQNSHIEEKPRSKREGGDESTDGSDIAKWCARLKHPYDIKVLHWTKMVKFNRRCSCNTSQKHISHLLQEGNYTSINPNKSYFRREAHCTLGHTGILTKGQIKICPLSTIAQHTTICSWPVGKFGVLFSLCSCQIAIFSHMQGSSFVVDAVKWTHFVEKISIII